MVDIKSACIAQGELYEVMGECSPLYVYDVFVSVDTVDGKQYAHGVRFKSWSVDDEGIVGLDYSYEEQVNRLLDRVVKKGSINPEFWIELNNRPSYALGEVDEASLMDDEERHVRGM